MKNVVLFPTQEDRSEELHHIGVCQAYETVMPYLVGVISTLVDRLDELDALSATDVKRSLVQGLLEQLFDELTPRTRRIMRERGWPAGTHAEEGR